jgi:quinol monooxygenase YgiN
MIATREEVSKSRWLKTRDALLFLASSLLCACAAAPVRAPQDPTPDTMLTRLSELEIEPGLLTEYLSILREESAASVRLEPGVVAIFPMQLKESPTQIRIVEVYATRAAYEAHLQTPHFKHYKNATLHMVKALRLIDVSAADQQTMSRIFRKMGE